MELAGKGAEVLTFGRDPAALEDALGAFADLPGKVHGFTADIATPGGVAQIFKEVDGTFGGLDILISSAAPGADPIDEMDEDWRYVVELDLIGAMAATRGALKRLKEGGQVVIIGSISSVVHAPGESVYSATEAGLAAFAETLRKEVEERGIRVSLVEPGAIGSDMQETSPEEQREKIARHEMLCAEDIAEAVGFIVKRPTRADAVTLRMEPRIQELG